jgi:hypothetical protein
MESGLGDLKIMQNIGKVIEADMEPTDICLVSHTAIAKTRKASDVGIGSKAIKTPAEVATPFPPLKFKNMVQICPNMQAKPVAIINM